MPTILEHLCRAVRQGHEGGIEQPRAISMIANPSARVQMAAVRRDKKCHLLY